LNRFGLLTLEELNSRSSLTDNQIRHGLVAMIQHHLVYHFREGGDTWYQANTQKAYYLVRSGKFLRIVGARLGEFAARVMTEILLHGHISIKELECLPALQSHQYILDTTNALEERSSKIYSILQGLASDRYILPISETDFQSPADRWAKAQQDGNDIHILHYLNKKENAKEVLIHAKELPDQ
jgi:DNA-directed RNA polymerase III subunit RPC3